VRRTLALALLLLAGCPSAPERPRYVEPASALLGAPAPAAAASASGVIRLRSVDAAAAIERRVLWRLSDVELGEEQWTEAPSAYVAQALGRELFEVRGLSRGAGPDAPVLDVVVRRFEEDRREAGHRARVALTLVLLGADGRGLLERTVEVERVITREQGDEVEAMAAAMGAALDAAVRQGADALLAALPAAR
jgi:uncharacterized lipoprotein YmbA